MANKKASSAANDALKVQSKGSLDGWIFYATRNGKALVESANGNARRRAIGSHPVLPYSAQTIVHVASVSKLICGIAILRFIEEWNEIADALGGKGDESSNGPRKYRGNPRPTDEKLIASVERWDGHLHLDDRIYPFLKDHLKWVQLKGILPVVIAPPPGLAVDEITIRELLTHTSGLRDFYYDNGLKLLNLKREDIKQEITIAGKAKFKLVQDCAVVLASDVVSKENSYCNDGFTLLGALIEFQTGTRYEDWVKSKLTFDRRFYDIARHPVDVDRAARYYDKNVGNVDGVPHPDYADFSAAGGFYTSAGAICDWLDAIMQKEEFGGRPLLRFPELLLDFKGWAGPGDDRFDFGPLQGFAKNGGTTVGILLPLQTNVINWGWTNARVCYLKGYGNDRITAFFQTNQPADADPMLVAGLTGIRSFIYPPTVLPSVPIELVSHTGLRAKVWRPISENVETTSMRFTPTIQFGVSAYNPVSGLTELADRTNLLDGSSGPFSASDRQFVELTGMLVLPAGSYKLRLTSDDGSMLFLDDLLHIDNDQNHSLRSIESSASVSFSASGRKLRILWYNYDGGAGLYLESISASTGMPQPIPLSCFHTLGLQLQPPVP